jgi:presequence protease
VSHIPESGTLSHGFLVQAVTPLPELRLVAVLAEHEASGARLLHLVADDPENLMAVGFRTPPPDSTGLPHILEHTVLCGSRKYPVKDPFVELLKTSLATFLNALTYPDRTVYPCASMNRRDFFNAASVYLDAVFHPNLTEAHFKQEGHHFEFERKGDPSSPLTVSGIVYNEMKGVYSSLDGMIWRATEGLYPDTAYGFDSGGDPDEIPRLTYDQFRAFHERYYHPSNALLFLYGDIPTEDHFKFLHEESLHAYGRLAVENRIPHQPRWTEPRRITVPYPAAPDDTPERTSAFVLAWLACEITDPVETFAWGLLSQYLLGHDGSPLHQALMESGLGGEVCFEGHVAYRLQTLFGVGMKETSPERAVRIEALVFRVLRETAAGGLDPERLASCFHQCEIAVRDLPQNYPLVLMDRVFNAWMYEADPLLLLRAREHLADLRRRSAADPDLFPSLIRRGLLENPHRLAMLFVPDPELNARRDRARAERWAGVKAGLSPEDLARIAREAEALDRMQREPNTPETLATLPRLHPSDVPVEPPPLPVARAEVEGRPWLRADLFANGLSHLLVAVDLNGLPEEDTVWLPLYAAALSGMGAAGRDYAAFAERESALCRGVRASLGIAGDHRAPERRRPMLYLSGSALDERMDGLLDVFGERWFETDFDDARRLKDLVTQEAIGRREAASEAGHLHAAAYAARGLSAAAAWSETTGGVTQARFMRDLAARVQRDAGAVIERLRRLHEALREAGRIHAAFVGGDAAAEAARVRLGQWLRALRPAPAPEAPAAVPAAPRRAEGIAMPSDVAYVAAALPAVPAADPRAPALMVLAGQLTYGYLWNEVRVRRGAYGCSARYDQAQGLFCLSSFRDPGVADTRDTYARAPAFVEEGMDLSPAAVEQQVIGAFKGLDAPIRPGRAVSLALGRHLSGMDDAARIEFRARLRAVTGADLRAVAAEIIAPGLRAASHAVIAGRPAFEAARERWPELKVEEF